MYDMSTNTNTNTETNTDTELVVRAAKYFLKYSGMRGNDKQIAKLMNTTPGFAIINMAVMRGFKC